MSLLPAPVDLDLENPAVEWAQVMMDECYVSESGCVVSIVCVKVLKYCGFGEFNYFKKLKIFGLT